jgi:ribosomal subunit interface protein
MTVGLEVTYRDVEKTETTERLIREKVDKLERLCDYISNISIVLEKAHERPKSGSPFRVRIDLTMPPSHALVASSNAEGSTRYIRIESSIRDAFQKMERQLKEITSRQRDEEHTSGSAAQDTMALVVRLFASEGYGFLKDVDDAEEIYFHRNSVAHGDFDRLQVGTGVRYTAVEGEQGLQASTVQIVDKPGALSGKAVEPPVTPPVDWR